MKLWYQVYFLVKAMSKCKIYQEKIVFLLFVLAVQIPSCLAELLSRESPDFFWDKNPKPILGSILQKETIFDTLLTWKLLENYFDNLTDQWMRSLLRRNHRPPSLPWWVESQIFKMLRYQDYLRYLRCQISKKIETFRISKYQD